MNGSPIEIVIGMCLRRKSRLRPLVQIRCEPQTMVGMIGTPDPAARRTAPVFSSLISKEREMVPSAKMPTISPPFNALSAVTKDPVPFDRSTLMWCMPRIKGPLSLWSKISFLAMKRTRRLRPTAANPVSAKSR